MDNNPEKEQEMNDPFVEDWDSGVISVHWSNDDFRSKMIKSCYPGNNKVSYEDDEKYLRSMGLYDIREAYKNLENSTPFEKIIVEYLPVWKRLSSQQIDKVMVDREELICMRKEMFNVICNIDCLLRWKGI